MSNILHSYTICSLLYNDLPTTTSWTKNFVLCWEIAKLCVTFDLKLKLRDNLIVK